LCLALRKTVDTGHIVGDGQVLGDDTGVAYDCDQNLGLEDFLVELTGLIEITCVWSSSVSVDLIMLVCEHEWLRCDDQLT
jgi:hypothetical protein